MHNSYNEPLMAKKAEKSTGSILFENIQDLTPVDARKALKEAEDRYFQMLDKRIEENTKNLEHSKMQMKEFQS